MTDRVRVSREGRVLEIVLAAGERGNALDLSMAEALRDAVRGIESEDVACVLVRAEGKNFCVGGDLRDFADRGSGTASHVNSVATTAHDAVLMLTECRVPVVTAVHGAVAGAGVGLALSGDLIVAARSAKFRLAYTAVGLSPDCGGSWHLPRLIGQHRALDLALTNRVVGAEEALAWGLVSRLVEPESLVSEAKQLAEALAEGHTAALVESKRLIKSAPCHSLRAHLDAEADEISALASTDAAQAAIAAFVR